MPLGDLIIKVGANIDGFRVAMKDAVDQIDYFADEIEKRFASIESVGKRLVTVGAELTAAVTLPLVALGTAAITTAAQFETTQIAFNTLSGSAEAATAQLGALYKFAAETPFQVAGVLQGARTLTAMQFAAKDVIPVLRVLGDTAAGLGLGQEGLERLTFHLGQIKALGSIDGKIIREMGIAGINAAEMLATSLGKTVPEVMDMVHKKAINSTTAINALLIGMQEKFGGLMEDQMKSLSGAWSNLKDNVTLAMVQVGNTLLPIGKDITGVLGDLTEKVKQGAEWFAHLPVPIQNATLAAIALVPVFITLATVIGGIMVTLPGLIALAGALSLSLGAMAGSVAVATGGLALLIPALVALGTWVSEHVDGVVAFGKSLLSVGFVGVGTMSAAVEAFIAVDAGAVKAKASTDAVTKALHDLHMTGTAAFKALSDPKTVWEEQHAQKLKIVTDAVHALETAEKSAGVTAAQLATAHQHLNAVMAEKYRPLDTVTPKVGKLSDVEREHAKEIDGELAHSKALLAIELDRIKFLLAAKKLGDEEYLDLEIKLQNKEDVTDRAALEAKKAIYKNHLTERQSIENQIQALADKSALHVQQASEKVALHEGKTWETYITGIKKTFAETTKELQHSEAEMVKAGLQADKLLDSLKRVADQRKTEAEENTLAMKKLELARQYTLQIGVTAKSEIEYARQVLRLDKEEAEGKIKLLVLERDGEKDTLKRAELDARVARARDVANQHEYDQMTRIKQLQQQNTVLGQVQLGLWNSFNNAFRHLTSALSDAITGAKTWGAAIKGVLADIGREILDTLVGAVLGKLAGALAGIVLNFLGVKSAASVTDVAQVSGSAGVGGAAAAAAAAPLFWWNPAIAVAIGAAMAASIGGAFGPLAAFETGTAFVPSTGIAMIHEGERIVDAASNRTISDALSRGVGTGGGSSNVQIVFNGVTSARDISREVMKVIKQVGGPRFSPATS